MTSTALSRAKPIKDSDRVERPAASAPTPTTAPNAIEASEALIADRIHCSRETIREQYLANPDMADCRLGGGQREDAVGVTQSGTAISALTAVAITTSPLKTY